MYADQAAAEPGAPVIPDPLRPRAHHEHRAPRPWLPIVAVAVALILVAVIGGAMLLFGDGDDGATATDPASESTDQERPSDPPATEPTPRPEPEPSEPAEPRKRGKPTDVTSLATASTAQTAPPNQDVDGNLVRYEPDNMLDGVPATTWRMPGDGAGSEIQVSLPEPTRLTRLGLVNGYAKRSGAFDWYAGNRRVTAVEWVLDDGTTIPQSLSEQRQLQMIDIEPVATETVLLRIVSVTTPGTGPSSRDYTAISDLSLVGATA